MYRKYEIFAMISAIKKQQTLYVILYRAETSIGCTKLHYKQIPLTNNKLTTEVVSFLYSRYLFSQGSDPSAVSGR